MYGKDWNSLLCNGCYGYLLSVYNVKAGTDPHDVSADRLAELLLACVSHEAIRQAAERLRLAENRTSVLSPQALRFLATSDYVAGRLDAASDLEWSPAIIGLCKALEVELVRRLIDPLKDVVQGMAFPVISWTGTWAEWPGTVRDCRQRRRSWVR